MLIHCFYVPRTSRYSHGYLYPSTVAEIRSENISHLSTHELSLRGGKEGAHSYSTVSRFGRKYNAPLDGLSPNQAIEALVEGSEMSLLSRLPKAQRQLPPTGSSTSVNPDVSLIPDVMEIYSRRPTRLQRFNDDPHERGGTVVVHYVKKHEWFLETAIAMLGSWNRYPAGEGEGLTDYVEGHKEEEAEEQEGRRSQVRDDGGPKEEEQHDEDEEDQEDKGVEKPGRTMAQRQKILGSH